MKYLAALEAAKSGAVIRHAGCGRGWTARWGDPGPDLWWRNPVTGSEHAFVTNAKDRERTDWSAK